MSRSESYSEGRVPLHTIRADIDYGFAEAKTTYGRIGVKVWINKGEIMPEGFGGESAREARASATRIRRGGVAAARSRASARPASPAAAGASRTARASAPCVGVARPRRSGRQARVAAAVGGPGGGAARGRGRRPRPRRQDNVERPRTDEQAPTAEGREQPAVEPEVADDAAGGRRRAGHDHADAAGSERRDEARGARASEES